ncbi:MAG: putative ABC transporter permease [Lachnospiraceae bacterium]|nr:putative ABC transporter permease [Lachnospiraceae bacterium]
MWSFELFGTDVYHLVAAFVIYSVMGWFVESVYMSFCNKKLTNRGFAKGPFCPIYGFGAVAGYLILSPLEGHYVKVYLLGAFFATVFEFIVGKGMIRFLGDLWWDYNEKPFNYQGIVCLESTIAWGFYALGIIHFVHGGVNRVIDSVEVETGIFLLCGILALVIIDYIIQLVKVFEIDVSEKKDRIIERCYSLITRWY